MRRAAFLVLLLASGCDRAQTTDEGWTEEELALLQSMSLHEARPPVSPSNQWADMPAAAAFGEALFFDPGLSGDGSISCASCHKPALYFTDGQPTAVGAGQVGRHTPTVIGAAWYPFQTWDGRKDSLWSQALAPFEGDEEMSSHRLLVHRRVAAEHAADYERVFGSLPPVPPGVAELDPEGARRRWQELDPVTRESVTEVFVNVGKAIEAYERQLLPQPAPFDRYVEALLAGDPTGGGHLSPAAVRGLEAFTGEAGCVHCHNGPLLTDMTFHNLGLPVEGGEPDPGRGDGLADLMEDEFRSDGRHADGTPNPELAYVDPDFEDALGAFKTPSLRNVGATAPYGHAGQFADLDELLSFYREDHARPAIGHLDPLLDLVDPDFEPADMLAFLQSLTGPRPRP